MVFSPLNDYKNITKWINLLINERISPSIKIKLNKNENIWIINANEYCQEVKIDFNKEFFVPGYKSDFPCQEKILKNKFFNSSFSNLPAPGSYKHNSEYIFKKDSLYHLNYDVFGFCFWMMNRSEELFIESKYKDLHGRFKAEFSHAFKHNYLSRPLVDEWLIFLKEFFNFLYPDIYFFKTKFKIVPSHDIDNPRKFKLISKKRILKNYINSVKDILSELKNIIHKSERRKININDPYDTFAWIMDMSDKYNLKNEFYIMSGHSNWRYDTGYEINNKEILYLLKEIYNRGHSIGIHPSYNASNCKNQFYSQANNLKKVLKSIGIFQEKLGGRMHYLRFHNPQTSINFSESGFSYDSSLGYAGVPGFRCGTCFEFSLYDQINNQLLNLRERPLILMEASILSNEYLGITSFPEFKSYVKDLKEKCFKVNGEFIFLWHNCKLDSHLKREMYEYLLHPIE